MARVAWSKFHVLVAEVRAPLPQFRRHDSGYLVIFVGHHVLRRGVVFALTAPRILRFVAASPHSFALVERVAEHVADRTLSPLLSGRVRDAARVEQPGDLLLRVARGVERKDFTNDPGSLFGGDEPLDWFRATGYAADFQPQAKGDAPARPAPFFRRSNLTGAHRGEEFFAVALGHARVHCAYQGPRAGRNL